MRFLCLLFNGLYRLSLYDLKYKGIIITFVIICSTRIPPRSSSGLPRRKTLMLLLSEGERFQSKACSSLWVLQWNRIPWGRKIFTVFHVIFLGYCLSQAVDESVTELETRPALPPSEEKRSITSGDSDGWRRKEVDSFIVSFLWQIVKEFQFYWTGLRK